MPTPNNTETKTNTPAQQSSAGEEQPVLQVPEFYANMVMLNVSPFEVELQNLLVDSGQNVKGAVNIRMSPQTAWMLSRSLERQLAYYEKRYGNISLPQELRKELE